MSVETVLITGASSGIGLEFANLFAADKCNLVLVARRRARLEKLAEELHSKHRIDVHVVDQDLAAPDGPLKVEKRIQELGFTIDILINNAGIATLGEFAETPWERSRDMIQLNVTSVTELTRRFLPEMLRRGQGRILNVASTAAFQPGGNMAVYFASKAYILSFTESIAEETRGTGVHITCLCPGPTDTELGEQSGVDKTNLFRLGTMSASAVAKKGRRAIRRGKTIEIPGLFSSLVVFLIRFTPRWIVRRISTFLLSKT